MGVKRKSLLHRLAYVAQAVVLTYVGLALDFYNWFSVKVLGGLFTVVGSPSRWARNIRAFALPLYQHAAGFFSKG